MYDQSHLVVIDAIDGAGKSTVIRAMTDWLKQQHLTIFDLVEYQRNHHALPDLEIHDSPLHAGIDVLLSAEPTYSWVGAALREEIIKTHSSYAYHGRVAAEAFALDRQVLFTRVILPFLQAKPNRWVIQDRGVISSLAYQPLQDEHIHLEWLLSLEGNRTELARPPELLLLLRLAPEEAMQRLENRGEKIDGHIYETATFQEKLAFRYRDPAVLAPYRDAGTKIVEIDASQSPEVVGKAACEALATILVPMKE